MQSNILKKINDLIDNLNKNSYLYYSLDRPIINDTEYDNMYKELKLLEKQYPDLIPEHSPTKRIGDKISDDFEKIEHSEPMLSLSNIYNFEDLVEFDNRVQVFLDKNKEITTTLPLYVSEPKFDGLAIAIIYKNGLLHKAITRGNGLVGEDVTHNVKTIKNVPLKIENIPDAFEIRGEIIVSFKEFEKQKDIFASPRNMAAGSIRQKDPKVTATRNLMFIAHSFTKTETESHWDDLKKAKDYGFTVHKAIALCKNPSEIKQTFDKIIKKRKDLEVPIDGLVIKINDKFIQKAMGNIAKAPRWAAAWKPVAKSEKTTVREIIFQVGRTGVLTPVANLEPIKIDGVTITRATLHNFSELQRKDICINDTVIVERAGDVIPYITEAIIDERKNKNIIKPLIPTICPECSTLLHKTSHELICTNLKCSARIVENIKHFVSKNAMNIKGFGTAVTKQLFKEKLINTYSDIYLLTKEQLIKLERMGEESSKNLINAINDSKNIELYRFIFALGIQEVGLEASKEIAKLIQNINYIVDEKLDIGMLKYKIETIKGLGPIVAKNISNYLDDFSNIEEIKKLLELGIKPFYEKINIIKNSQILGKTFVITGSFQNISRNEIKKLIIENGGKPTTSISKNTDFLICGEKAGSKLKKAKDLNIKIIDLDELYKKLFY